MWPTLLELDSPLGSIPVNTWGLFVMLAFLTATAIVHARAATHGIAADKLTALFVAAPIAGLFGARILHFSMAQTTTPLFDDPSILVKSLQGGFAFYGGFILAALVGAICVRRAGLSVARVADLCAPAVLLGLAIGRLGCFAAGCCHGRAMQTDLVKVLVEMPGGSVLSTPSFPWIALSFKPRVGVSAIHNTPLFPTQLWESAVALTLFLMLSWFLALNAKRRATGQIVREGRVFGLLLVSYAIARTTLENFRGDAVRGVDWFGSLSTSQVVSVPLFLIGLLLMFRGVSPSTNRLVTEGQEDTLLADLLSDER